MASAIVVDSSLVSGSVWTRMVSSPEVLTIGDDAASIPSSSAVCATASRIVVGVLRRWPRPRATDDAVLDAALELDAEVEALADESAQSDRDDHRGEGVPEPLAADEVDRDGAVVEVLAEAGELAHQALLPATAGRRWPRRCVSMPIVLRREAGQPVAGVEEREPGQPGDHRLGEQEEHREVDERADAEREREALHHADREDVEHDRREQRHRVGGQAGGAGPDPARLDGDPHRLALAHLVTDALEVDDERVGGDADTHDQARDAGQGQGEAGRLAHGEDRRRR